MRYNSDKDMYYNKSKIDEDLIKKHLKKRKGETKKKKKLDILSKYNDLFKHLTLITRKLEELEKHHRKVLNETCKEFNDFF